MDHSSSQENLDNVPNLPLSQETFNMLWSQLQSDAAGGMMLQEPVQVNLENFDYSAGDTNNIIENQVQFQVEHLAMEPHIPEMPSLPSLGSQSSFLAQLNATLPPLTTNERSPDSTMPSSTGYASATDTTTTPPPPSYTPPPNATTSPTLPTNVEYPGDYEFQINLGQPTSQAAKSVSWTYSPTLNKLFVDKDKPCPIQFKTSSPPPPGSYIRLLPIFKQAENLAEVVGRCPNHISRELTDISRHHIVLCSDLNTQYFTDVTSGRHSLCVPYSMPQVGTEYTKYLFTFKCFISCVGGLNRRKIQLVFSLENEGEVLGRQVLDVRVCACPGRDRKGEEKVRDKSKQPQKKPLKRGASKVTSSVGITSFAKKKKTDDEIFYIPVQGREKYELLLKIKESLDLMDFVTPNQMNQYRTQQQQLNNQLQLAQNGPPNIARVSSFQTSPSTSHSNSQNHAPPLNHTTPPMHTTPPNHNTPPPSMTRSHSFPTQPQHQPYPQHPQPQQLQPIHHDAAVTTAAQPQLQNLEPYPPSTSTNGLQRQNTTILKDETDGPHMEVDSIPASQGFGLVTSSQTPQTTTYPCHNQAAGIQDMSIYGWLTRLGYIQYSEIFNQKGIHSIDQLDEINLEDLSSLPHEVREPLWKHILDLRSKLQLGATPNLLHMSSSASTASVHSSGSLGGSQVYRATRFTLKQTLSFKVEKDDYEDLAL